MQHLQNRWFKIIFIVFPLLIIAIFVSFPILNKKSKSDNSQPVMSLRDKPEEYYDNFRVDRVSLLKRQDGKILFSLSADKVIHRKRISRLFVYQNLKEIYISGVKVDIYLYNNESSRHKNIVLPVDDIGGTFASLGKPPTPIEDYLSGNADINLDLLTRLLIEDLSINIHLPHDKKVSLSAKYARINIDLENMVLEEARVIALNGKELAAPQAVWSKRFNGIYFPEGYTLQNEQRKGKTFFVINREGELIKSLKVPEIEYKDILEDREKVFYADLSKKMPAYLRFMFGMGMPQK